MSVPPRRGKSVGILVLGLIAAAGIGAGGYFFLLPKLAEESAVKARAETKPESFLAIQAFLAADDWSDDALADFNIRWATLPADMQLEAEEQPWYQAFVEQVRARVKDQRALTATEFSAGTVNGPLAALATSVGIAISAPERVVPPRAADAADDAGSADANRTTPGVHAQQAGSRPAPDVRSATEGAPAPATTTAAVPLKVSKSADHAPATAAPKSGATPNTAGEKAEPCRAELALSRKPRCRDELSIGGLGPSLVVIRAGQFDMGNKDVAWEQPVHRVTIARPFAIGEFEASQAEYRLFCGETKRNCAAQPWTDDDMPVVQVNWQDARDYVAWLSKVSGRSYRLATEAEWEYAARSGGAALYPSGTALSPTDAVFSHAGKLSAPWPRGRKINANAFKLFHSIGNVREWVEDSWSANYAGARDNGAAHKATDSTMKVVRGGAYSDTAPKLRFTTREGIELTTRDNLTGFRVVRDL
jgi:formylglycine-generating enzyme required for sulfatase activity